MSWKRAQGLNIRIGRISWLISAPNLSWCYRCHTTWAYVVPHETRYSVSSACFPLCEKCWADLTPEQRLPYYEALISEWMMSHPSHHVDSADQIRAAVLAGK
jgi:hypothetical protein